MGRRSDADRTNSLPDLCSHRAQWSVEPLAITGLLLRRAVLGTLLAAGRPLTVREVTAALASAGATTSPLLSKAPNRVIADLLAHQARIGKVRRVAPGTYTVVPDSMSRSTRRRCVRWQFELAALRALIRQFPDPPLCELCPGSPLSDTVGVSERGELTQSADPPAVPGHRNYPAAMITVEPATHADLAELTAQGAALFREDAGQYDTYIDLTWSQREGRADFERLIADSGSAVLVARFELATIGHLVGYTHSASPTRLAVTYANLRSLYVEPSQRRRGAAGAGDGVGLSQ